MTTPNPWTIVPAADYERHMGPEGGGLLAPLSAIFQEAYLSAQPDRVLVPGCATGNGLEHVDPSVTARVVGVDVNLQYLGVARQRFFHLGPRLELFCADACAWRAAPGSFDLVHAGLIFEYLYPEVLVRRIVEWLADRGTCSVVLELPGGEGPPPPSRALQLIEKAKKLVPPEELGRLFQHYGIPLRRSREVEVPLGRRLWVGTFGREAAPK
ncbi:MAG TPA: class I SAM-dependent methyltransferase [Anaeromyxobacter sp.]|nr:class I SAM-dependent methyltransferase [Anaeromyxobacter sp.]